jgi:flagellar motor switch protein FliG
MQEKQPKGFLFERIAYFSDESIQNMIDNLDKKTIPYLLTQALEYAHSKNVFNLIESELISKCLRIINKETYSYDDTAGQETDNVKDN